MCRPEPYCRKGTFYKYLLIARQPARTAQASRTLSTGPWRLDAGAADMADEQATNQSGLNPYYQVHAYIQTLRVFHPYNCSDIDSLLFRLR